MKRAPKESYRANFQDNLQFKSYAKEATTSTLSPIAAESVCSEHACISLSFYGNSWPSFCDFRCGDKDGKLVIGWQRKFTQKVSNWINNNNNNDVANAMPPCHQQLKTLCYPIDKRNWILQSTTSSSTPPRNKDKEIESTHTQRTEHGRSEIRLQLL